MWRVLHHERVHSYHMQRVQNLSPTDYWTPVEFAMWLRTQAVVDLDFDVTALFIHWHVNCTVTRMGISNNHDYHVLTIENSHITKLGSYQRNFWITLCVIIVHDFGHTCCQVLWMDIHTMCSCKRGCRNYWTLFQQSSHSQPSWIKHDEAPTHYKDECLE